MFKLFKNLFKKKIDTEKEWMINMIIAMARLSMIKPEILNRESKNINRNHEFLIKLINGYNGHS